MESGIIRIADLRQQLREKRKEHLPPVSRMSKEKVMGELSNYSAASSKMPEPVKAATTVAKPVIDTSVVQKQVRIVEKVDEATAKRDEMKDKTRRFAGGKKAVVETVVSEKVNTKVGAMTAEKKKRLAKGSQEAKDYMAAIRAKRKH